MIIVDSIPKIIHYCWFGGNPLPELAQKCIESWKKYCPDYEIKRWDETNFDINCCDYVREAYQAKMWAFVSDYARFKILFENGGVYFDTDVELLKPIDDIVKKGAFMGLEEASVISVNSGLGLGANIGLSIFQEILDNYHHSHFEMDEHGIYETVVTRVTKIILKHGGIYPDKITNVAGITIYPPEYFCPFNFCTGEMKLTDNSYSIHHYMATWTNKWDKRIITINRKFEKHTKFARVLTFPMRVMCKIEQLGLKGTIRFIVNHKL